MAAAVKSRTLTLHYIDGRPDGLLTAEMFDWAGHVLAAPRTELAEALARPEFAFVGVYLLLGDQEARPRAYIGESENIVGRIKSHDANKDWWTRLVLITAGAKLNKAHVRYLEGRLIEEATRVGWAELENGTSPDPQPLSEAERSNMEVFLENLRMVLPAVRVDLLVDRTRNVKATPASKAPAATTAAKQATPDTVAAPEFRLAHKKSGAVGRATVDSGGFVVLAGSTGRKATWVTEHETLGPLVRQLLRSGVRVDEGPLLRFTEDYAFGSPSSAGCLITGYSTNGQTHWKTASGQSYKAWEAAKLAAVGGRG